MSIYSSIEQFDVSLIKSIVIEQLVEKKYQELTSQQNEIKNFNIKMFNDYIESCNNEKIVSFYVYKTTHHVCQSFACKNNQHDYSQIFQIKTNKLEEVKDFFIWNNCSYCFFIMTNYGRILTNYEKDNLQNSHYDFSQQIPFQYIEYNIWLPLEYIEIINLIKPINLLEFVNHISKKINLDINNQIDNLKENETTKLNEEIKILELKLKEKDSIINKLESEKKSILSIKNDLFDLKSNKVIQKKVPINEFDISDDEQ